jgi:hypothetical protein
MLQFLIREAIFTGRTRREPDKNVDCSPKKNVVKLIVLNILLDYPSDALQRAEETLF